MTTREQSGYYARGYADGRREAYRLILAVVLKHLGKDPAWVSKILEEDVEELDKPT